MSFTMASQQDMRLFFVAPRNIFCYDESSEYGWNVYGRNVMANRIETIMRTVPLFQGLSSSARVALAGIARQRHFQKGEAIFSEGESGHGFFVVTEGRVKIFKLSADGKEQILHIFGAGEPFGEVPVFTGRHFPAHAMALECCRNPVFPAG